ncbi:MAG: PaaI family thioesterase [Myxococcota bacterium]
MAERPPLDESTDPARVAELLNRHRGGFDAQLGLEFVYCSGEKVVAKLPVTDGLKQPYGIVHGGVHCSVIETVCSTGAALASMSRGQSTVGLENSTSFLKAVREGTLTVTATPLTRGRRSQVWEARVTDDDGRLIATGRVRLLALESGSQLAGEPAGMKS